MEYVPMYVNWKLLRLRTGGIKTLVRDTPAQSITSKIFCRVQLSAVLEVKRLNCSTSYIGPPGVVSNA